MIEIKNKEATNVVKIVLSAMQKMHEIMHADRINVDTKVECANAIARLSAVLDTRPYLIFGDIDTMNDKGEVRHE